MLETTKPADAGALVELIALADSDVERIATALAAKLVGALAPGSLLSSSKPASVDDATEIAVTYKRAGELIGVSARTIWSLCDSGELKVISIGVSRRVLRASIDAYIAKLAASTDAPKLTRKPKRATVTPQATSKGR